MRLTTQEQILIEQRVRNDAKSIGAAYFLWLFLGGLGAHRFYLGQPRTAIAILAATLLGLIGLIGALVLPPCHLTGRICIGGWEYARGWMLSVSACIVGFGTASIWVVVDAFLVPGMVERHKRALRQRLTAEASTVPP